MGFRFGKLDGFVPRKVKDGFGQTKFQDPNQLIEKNKKVNSAAVNNAVVGAARQNTQKISQGLDQYTDSQLSRAPQMIEAKNVAQAIKGDGVATNRLNQILTGPNQTAQEYTGPMATNQTSQDFTGQIQRGVRNLPGQFYSPGMAALDGQIFDASGGEARANAEIELLNSGVNQRIARQETDINKELASRAAAVKQDAINQLKANRDGIKAENRLDIDRMAADDKAQKISQGIARAQGRLSDSQIADLYNNQRLGSVRDTFVADENINDLRNVNRFLGINETMDTGGASRFVDYGDADNRLADLLRPKSVGSIEPNPSTSQNLGKTINQAYKPKPVNDIFKVIGKPFKAIGQALNFITGNSRSKATRK